MKGAGLSRPLIDLYSSFRLRTFGERERWNGEGFCRRRVVDGCDAWVHKLDGRRHHGPQYRTLNSRCKAGGGPQKQAGGL